MRKFFKAIIWAAVIIFLIRIFVCQPFKIDDFTMSSTLIPGDRVMVKKLSTGVRFPNSILGLPGANRSYLDIFRIPYFRLPGFKSFKNNDVVVFNDPRVTDKPMDRSPLIISRIIGIPGDTVIVLDKKLFLNRQEISTPVTYRFIYRVVTNGEPIPEDFLREYQIEQPVEIADIGVYDILLDSIAHLAIQKLPVTKTVRMRKQFIGDSSNDYFPHSSFFFWNGDQYGPLIVPKKGLKVELNLRNVDLYKDILDIFEDNKLIIDFSGISINGLKVNSYTFKKDYYFVMDDNRDKGKDSRYIGFIPESHMLGTAKRILFNGKSDYNYIESPVFKRTLKKID